MSVQVRLAALQLKNFLDLVYLDAVDSIATSKGILDSP